MKKTLTQYDIAELAEFMRKAKDNNKPFVFFTGAGCSVTAGIPLAKKLIEEMHQRFKTELKLLVGDDRQDYGKCMAQIGRDDRRQFLNGYIVKAKINWAHIALACLLREGYIGRVLTFNFDNLLARSCGLLGLYPATYDFTAANLNLYHLIDNPAVVHLHGQSHGFAQLNSDEETGSHALQLSQFVCSTLNESPALFIGYSGQADAFFPQIKQHFCGQHRLFWVDMAEQAPAHIADSILQTSLAHYMRCADGADLFLIELAQQLGCFPPMIFTDPYAHLLEELEAVSAYPQHNEHKTSKGDPSDTGRSGLINTQDILQGLRQRLAEARQREIDAERPNYLELYLEGKYQEIIQSAKTVEDLDVADQIYVAEAYFSWALKQSDPEQEIKIYDELIGHFGENDVLALQELEAKAFVNIGVALGQLDLLAEAIEMYNELNHRFGGSDELELQEPVARALVNKGITLGQLGCLKDAVDVYDDVISRFGSSEALSLQESVAQALANKSIALKLLNRHEETLQVYDQLVLLYEKHHGLVSKNPLIHALNNKNFNALIVAKAQWKEQELAHVYLHVAKYGFGQALEKASDPTIEATILGNLAYVEFLLSQPDQAETHLREALEKGGEKLYRATLEDIAMHPIPPDADFQALLERLWQSISS